MSHLEDPIEDQLAKFIHAECLQSPTPIVAGSALGLQIQEHFPDINIKTQYQGLTSFVNEYCSENIIQIGKHGGDNLFIHKQRKNENEAESFQRQDAWAAFSDPRLNVRLIANPTPPSLRVLSPDQEFPDNYEEIERMNEPSYRKIAEEFVTTELVNEDEEKVQTINAIIAKTNFWFNFVNKVSELFGTYLKEKLLYFRVEKLKQIFKKRLEDIGMNNIDARDIISQIFKNRKAIPKKNKASSLLIQNHKSISYQQSESITKELIHGAVDSMSQNDLRRIWLPVGAIMDALEK